MNINFLLQFYAIHYYYFMFVRLSSVKKVITHPRVRKTIYKEERKVELKFALPAVILIAVLSLNVNGTIENPVN